MIQVLVLVAVVVVDSSGKEGDTVYTRHKTDTRTPDTKQISTFAGVAVVMVWKRRKLRVQLSQNRYIHILPQITIAISIKRTKPGPGLLAAAILKEGRNHRHLALWRNLMCHPTLQT